MSASDAAVPADTDERRLNELLGWLRLISAPNRSGEISIGREDAVVLLAEYDRRGEIEQRARAVVGTLQPEDTKSLAARGRTRVNLARWILGDDS